MTATKPDQNAAETLNEPPASPAPSRLLVRAISAASDPAVWFGIGTIVAALVILEILTGAGYISTLIIAAPSAAFGDIFKGENISELLHATRLTTSFVAVAVLLEVLFALPVGYLLFRYTNFGKAYEGWLAALFAAPIFLLYPLFMVIFGRGYVTLVIMGFAAGVIPIIVHVRMAFLTVPQTLIKVGRSFDLTEMQIFKLIMVPSGARTIFTGIRLGLVYTLINIIAIEYLVDVGGLGRLVSDNYFRFDINGTYAAIFAVSIISISFNVVVNLAEKLVK
jgi:NitT/TauT family transport system permease protein